MIECICTVSTELQRDECIYETVSTELQRDWCIFRTVSTELGRDECIIRWILGWNRCTSWVEYYRMKPILRMNVFIYTTVSTESGRDECISYSGFLDWAGALEATIDRAAGQHLSGTEIIWGADKIGTCTGLTAHLERTDGGQVSLSIGSSIDTELLLSWIYQLYYAPHEMLETAEVR